MKMTYIDIFAGCGGLSLGLYNSGKWKGLFSLEKDGFAFSTLKHNLIDNNNHFDWPDWLAQKPHDINQVLKNHKKELFGLRGRIDLVAGGPPCQGFSTAGRRNESDTRNKLIVSYIKFIRLVQPKVLIFENVKGFTMTFDGEGDSGRNHSQYVKSLLGRTPQGLKYVGYDVHSKLVDFSEYGVPQKRMRFILFGVRKDLTQKINPEVFFEKLSANSGSFLKKKGVNKTTTLSQAISDLLRGREIECPDSKSFKSTAYKRASNGYQRLLRENTDRKIPDSHRFAKHTPATTSKFKYLLKYAARNKTISEELKIKYCLKKYRVVPLSGSTPALTITTLPDDYVHYSEPRIFTVREYARIQSFNDWYEFKGKYTTGGHLRIKEVPRYSQVGNAVPPLFAEQMGLTLRQILND
jgi:DNA (cytosine-5)-methyltransferase 1